MQPERPRERPAASALLAAVAVLAVIGAGVLRTFHDATPRLAALGPFGSLILAAVVLLGALHLRQRRRGADLLDFPDPPRGLTLAQLLPLLIVVLAEKWVTTDVLASAYDWIFHAFAEAARADAVYRLWTALGLLGVTLALLPVARQVAPRLAGYLAGARVGRAARDVVIAAAVAGVAALAAAYAGGGSLAPPAAAPVAAGAQLARGLAEELFYRGLLQTMLVRLLIQAGLPDGRAPRLLGIIAVSLGFTLEHADAQLAPAILGGVLAYVFVMSFLLGTLLEVSRNLWTTMAAHAAHNLLLVGALPLPRGASGELLLTPAVLTLLFFAVLFGAVVVAHARRPLRAPTTNP